MPNQNIKMQNVRLESMDVFVLCLAGFLLPFTQMKMFLCTDSFNSRAASKVFS